MKNKKMDSQLKGFTLLEMLLVFLIISLIFFIMTINLKTFQITYKLKNEAKFLGSSLSSMQINSITNNTKGMIKITNKYINYYEEDKLIYQYQRDIKTTIKTNFPNNIIKINKLGNVYQGGTITIQEKNITKKIIIYLGNGRYKIE